MDITQIESPDASKLYNSLVTAINAALSEKDLAKIQSILKVISKYKLGPDNKRTPEVLVLGKLRADGYMTKLYAGRDSLNRHTTMYETSGYIPSETEKNDPRWKMALSVDVNPYTMKKNAKKFGWDIKRDGTPPLLRSKDK